MISQFTRNLEADGQNFRQFQTMFKPEKLARLQNQMKEKGQPKERAGKCAFCGTSHGKFYRLHFTAKRKFMDACVSCATQRGFV